MGSLHSKSYIDHYSNQGFIYLISLLYAYIAKFVFVFLCRPAGPSRISIRASGLAPLEYYFVSVLYSRKYCISVLFCSVMEGV